MALVLRTPPGVAEADDPRALEYFHRALHDMLRLIGTTTVDMGSISAGGIATFTITVTGARVGQNQTVQVTPPAAIEAGLVWAGYVSSNDVVTVRVHNTTGGAVNPASATWGCRVMP